MDSRMGLRKEFADAYKAAAGKVNLVQLPALPFLMVEGAGDPNTSPAFQEAINALYALAYTGKFTLKARDPALDFDVMPLEGLWSGPDPDTVYDKSQLSWTLLMMMPRWMTPALLEELRDITARKKPLEALARVRLETFAEGVCAQTLHVGPYDTERVTIDLLLGWMASNGYEQNGRHHEVYLSDPRRIPPERYRTIIRHPVSKTAAPESGA